MDTRGPSMTTITIELPDDTALPFGDTDDQFARALRLAAAIYWYDRGMISQGKGAEIAGLSRADFLDVLFRAKVPACQVTVDELKAELESWQRLSGESSMPRP
jgi:predicted HTH domain antitoxin